MQILEMVFSTLFASLALAQAAPVPPAAPIRIDGRTTVQNERRVSLRVQDASLKDVLGKLPKVDYVVDADAFKNRRITLNLSDVPVSRALDAIASALDAHWEEQGGIRILKPGGGYGFGGTAFRRFNLPNDGKPFAPITPETQKKLDELRLRLKDAPPLGFRLDDGKTPPPSPVYGLPGERKPDIDELLKSLTPAQKALAKGQGYLKLSDLTPEQRRMTGFAGDGTFEMTITRDGETVKIRN